MNERRRIERVYTDPSAAQERATRLKALGFISVQIKPWNGFHVLTAMGTDDQIGRL